MAGLPHCADVMEQIPEGKLSELSGAEENQTENLPSHPESKTVSRACGTLIHAADTIDGDKLMQQDDLPLGGQTEDEVHVIQAVKIRVFA